MSMTTERDAASGLAITVARCDDCGQPVAIATQAAIVEERLRRRNPAWRPGMPVFCPDMQACAERVWNRYGRHMQALIDEQERTRQRVAGELRQAAGIGRRARRGVK